MNMCNSNNIPPSNVCSFMPERDHAFEDVLMFIGRFTTDITGTKTRDDVIECFIQGCCYWFAYILRARFEQEYGAEIVTDYTANHFGTRIKGRVYDITGDVTDDYNWVPWSECEDELRRKRIVEDCIMF